MGSYIELGNYVDENTKAWDGEGGNMPPVGEYHFRITGTESGAASTGTPSVNLEFTVAEGEHEGKTIRGYYYLSPKAVGRLLNVLEAVGLSMDEKGGIDTDALIGTELMAKVVENTYESGTNAMTGEKIMKTNLKVQGERPYEKPKAAARPTPATAGKAAAKK